MGGARVWPIRSPPGRREAYSQRLKEGKEQKGSLNARAAKLTSFTAGSYLEPILFSFFLSRCEQTLFALRAAQGHVRAPPEKSKHTGFAVEGGLEARPYMK